VPAPSSPRAWQRMLSGRRLDLLQPAPEDIAIEDIAHGLARVARWNGQTSGSNPFSVAQHSLLVERVAGWLDPSLPPAGQLAALLHDSPEYVIGDLISPFKVMIGDAYKSVERRLLDAIHARFGLPPETPATALIKRADQLCAYAEATQLAGFSIEEAALFFARPGPVLAEAIGILAPLSAPEAEHAFLHRFEALSRALS
jgi:5'-deoxynucleotidase YfbR-like HD superfamily hydrolase